MKTFEQPTVELIRFGLFDIVTTSGELTSEKPEQPLTETEIEQTGGNNPWSNQ